MKPDIDRIRLRAPEPSDAALLYQWENDISLWHVSDTLAPVSMFKIEQFILDASDIYTNRQQRFMIDKISEAKPKTVGTVDLYDFDPRHKRAGIGIMIAAEDRGKGYGSTAVRLCTSFAFDTLSIHQLFCFINADNQASLNLFRKQGFIQTGERKQWILAVNGWTDQLQFQLFNPKDQR